MSNSDLLLARILLEGSVERDARGKLRTKYLKEGSREERDARRALASLLRSDVPLDGQLRTSLAHLLDPDPPAWQQRIICFAKRGPGKPRDHVANTQIYEHTRNALNSGTKITAAIAYTAEKFDISQERVKRVWAEYRRVYGPPKNR